MTTQSGTARSEAALGFRTHSGWAALVALAGPAADPSAVLRRRVELSVRTPRQPFHAAEPLGYAKAEDLIRRATEEATALAARAVKDAVADLASRGHARVAAGLLLARGRPLPGLRGILASHALIHAAEGELFREVLRKASRGCGLALVEAGEHELEELAAQSLRRTPREIQERLAGWGKALGSPWTLDEKRAALVAWVALSGGGGRPT